MMGNKMVYSSVRVPGILIAAVRKKTDFMRNKSMLDVQLVGKLDICFLLITRIDHSSVEPL